MNKLQLHGLGHRFVVVSPDDAQHQIGGYYSTDGLGLLEYLEWCEDLRMVPVLAVYAGYSLGGEYVPAGPRLQPCVQDALDEIQYATQYRLDPFSPAVAG